MIQVGRGAKQAQQAATQAASEAAPQGIQGKATKAAGLKDSTDSETLTNDFKDAFDSTKKGFFQVRLRAWSVCFMHDIVTANKHLLRA